MRRRGATCPPYWSGCDRARCLVHPASSPFHLPPSFRLPFGESGESRDNEIYYRMCTHIGRTRGVRAVGPQAARKIKSGRRGQESWRRIEDDFRSYLESFWIQLIQLVPTTNRRGRGLCSRENRVGEMFPAQIHSHMNRFLKFKTSRQNVSISWMYM